MAALDDIPAQTGSEDGSMAAQRRPRGGSEAKMTEPIMLYSAEIDANPFPAYRRLRDAFPCYWSDDAGIWFLSRYADVATVSYTHLTLPTKG